MKPSWEEAPSWANWLAMDEDGEWWWYEERPKIHHHEVSWAGTGGKTQIAENGAPWKHTLELKPD